VFAAVLLATRWPLSGELARPSGDRHG
jgi:hypothetical protein